MRINYDLSSFLQNLCAKDINLCLLKFIYLFVLPRLYCKLHAMNCFLFKQKMNDTLVVIYYWLQRYYNRYTWQKTIMIVNNLVRFIAYLIKPSHFEIMFEFSKVFPNRSALIISSISIHCSIIKLSLAKQYPISYISLLSFLALYLLVLHFVKMFGMFHHNDN